MMGTERIGQIAQTLVKHGMDSATPIAMVRWGTTGRQRSIEGTLANIAEVANNTNIQPPTVAVIGEVVKLRPKLNWLSAGRYLAAHGRYRSREQAGQLSGQLRELGPKYSKCRPSRSSLLLDARMWSTLCWN